MANKTLQKGKEKMPYTEITRYKIIRVRGHWEVYIDGHFICSEDKWNDAVREAEEYLAERR